MHKQSFNRNEKGDDVFITWPERPGMPSVQ
jgi:hypothetical protein